MGAFSRICKVASVIAATTCFASTAAAADPKALVDARAKAGTEFPACTNKDPNIEGARGAHKAAKEFYESGAYQRAIRSWGDAYEFDCTKPEVFRNISNAYEKLADKPAALALLEIYLAREPSPDPNAKIKAQNLRREIEEEEAKAAPASTAPAPPAPTATTTGAKVEPPPGSYDGAEEERPFGVVPWIVAGGGVALLGAGIPLLVVGTGKISDANDQCPDRDACDDPAVRDLGNEGLTFQGVGIGLTAAGGAALIAGLIWQFAGNQPRPVAATYVLPTAGRDHLGAIVGGSF